MIRYYLLSSLAITVGLFLFGGCQRDSAPAVPQRFRLSQIKTSSFFVKGDSAFLQYGSSGKLTSYTTVIGGSVAVGTLSYNEMGQLTRSEEKPAPGVAAYSNYRTYTYDQAGNLTIEFYATLDNNQTYSLRRIDKVEYNTQAQPVKTTTITYTETGKLTSTSTAENTYTNGNVVSVNVIETAVPRTTTTTFQFDDKPNPFYGMNGFFTGFGGPDYNRTNITARRGGIEDADVRHELTYDTNGLLVTQVMNANLTSNRQVKYFYKYTTY